MMAVYFEDGQDHCHECCLFDICSCEGKCPCDRYREEHDPNCEGDYFFAYGDDADPRAYAIKKSAPTNTIPIEKAKEAFCKSHGCGIPSSTCHSLGTCLAYDAFAKALCEQMEGGKE